jgi:hypothetical protein
VGPSVSDPRSGEIIESDIMVSQSFTFIQKPLLTRNWSSKPISENFKHWDEEIGEMMLVIAHEVGHALGFLHMGLVMLVKSIEMVLYSKKRYCAPV